MMLRYVTSYSLRSRIVVMVLVQSSKAFLICKTARILCVAHEELCLLNKYSDLHEGLEAIRRFERLLIIKNVATTETAIAPIIVPAKIPASVPFLKPDDPASGNSATNKN